ncbi:MAG: hypothetical protein QF464_19485, partial [Myxococcota bacterium]|nr:hypothetical protein [Myxococcota bacterium]
VEVEPDAETRVSARLALPAKARVAPKQSGSDGILGGVLLGSAGGTAIIATTLWVFAANRANDAREYSNLSQQDAWKTASDSSRDFEIGAWVTTAATIGLVGAGVAMLLMPATDDTAEAGATDETATTWAPVVTPISDGFGVGAVVRF